MAAVEKTSGGTKRKFLRARVLVPLAAVLFAILLFPGASMYYS